MFLRKFQCQGVRNILPTQIELSSGLNIFYGINGAGKSSILEAISLLTSGRSFRTSKIEFVTNKNAPDFSVFGETESSMRLGLGFNKADKKKTIKINGDVSKALSKLSIIYPTQVLSPESYHLIDAGPGERRKYLDWCLFHVEHRYHESWKSYSQILKQRNALLRSSGGVVDSRSIEPWDSQLIQTATVITKQRRNILKTLENQLSEIVEELNLDFARSIKIDYYPGYTDDFADRLKTNLRGDFESGFTKAGPHKADLRIKVEGKLARDYLSRGQKKVLINALYLAQTSLLKKLVSKDSLFVIDDFTSELDANNQQALLKTLLAQNNVQIILSCLQLESLNWLKTGYNRAHMFHVEHGEITPVEPLESN